MRRKELTARGVVDGNGKALEQCRQNVLLDRRTKFVTQMDTGLGNVKSELDRSPSAAIRSSLATMEREQGDLASKLQLEPIPLMGRLRLQIWTRREVRRVGQQVGTTKMTRAMTSLTAEAEILIGKPRAQGPK